MSYILDALRKSEQERRHADSLVALPGVTETIALPPRRVAPWMILIGVTVLLAGLAAGFYVLRQPERVAATPNATAFSIPVTVVPARENGTTPPVAGAAQPALVVPPPPELTSQPALSPAPMSTDTRDLAAEARSELRKPKPPVVRAREDAAAATPAETKLALAAPANEPIKFLNAMPPEFRKALPELTVNIHIYAPRDADRILYINNRQYHTGDHVRDDIVVEAIAEDGVVLSYHGQRFKLPRPQ